MGGRAIGIEYVNDVHTVHTLALNYKYSLIVSTYYTTQGPFIFMDSVGPKTSISGALENTSLASSQHGIMIFMLQYLLHHH